MSEPKEEVTQKSKLFSYADLMACVRYYALFACAPSLEDEAAEQRELVRGWVEEKRPSIYRKLFKGRAKK